MATLTQPTVLSKSQSKPKPDTFRIERSTRIKAPAATIFPLIDDFQRWMDWSPYEHLGGAMQRTYSGAVRGAGAVYSWDSKGKAGAGRMEILSSEAPNRIVIRLDFLRPFKACNTAEFTFEPIGDSTKVTWSMSGSQSLMHRLMCMVFNMDAMVGKDFAKGLAAIKAVAEA